MDHHAVGRTIRSIRKSKNVTIAKLAEEVGVTPGYISQLERGLSKPSIRMVEKIADYFGISFGNLISESESNESASAPQSSVAVSSAVEGLVKADKRPKLLLEDAEIESLLPLPSMGLPFFAYITGTPEDNANPTSKTYSHDGFEFIYVLEGSITWHVEGKACLLEPGDSLYYSGKANHWGENPSPDMRLLVVQIRDNNTALS